MSEPANKAIFLSYASQDAEAVQRIADALRAAGIEVWFDKNELVGGDAWDQKIRRQIKDCALFVPVISANTNARAEGYFRLEWKLAVDRSHLMADDAPFLLPVVIDDTSDTAARVPDKFREVQWMRLNVKDTPETLAARVAKLLGGAAPAPTTAPTPAARRSEGNLTQRNPWAWLGYAWAIVGLIVGGFYALRPLFSGSRSEEKHAAHAPVQPVAPANPASNSAAPAAPALSEARQIADRAFAMSVDSYDSTLDDYVTAEALMKRALALDPNDGEILARSAEVQLMFRNRGFDFAPERIATGREQTERAIRLVPNSPEALVALSFAQRYTGNSSGQIESLKRAVALAPDHARALLALGAAYTLGGINLDEGLELYRRASTQPKWAPLADYFEFLRFWARRDFAAAEAAARRSYTARPSANSAGAIAMLHLTGKGDLDEAARELAAVPSSLLNTPRVVWLTAQVNLNRRAADEALRVLDRQTDDFIRDSWFVGPKALLVGRAHALAGRMNAARLAWESGLRVMDAQLKSEPGDATFRRARGELLAWLGRTDEALQEARTVDEIRRGRLDSWNFSNVTIYAVLGRADLAVPLLRKMLTAENNWPLTPTLLRQDPLWDKIRDDPEFQKLVASAAATTMAAASAPAGGGARDWPHDPELKRAVGLLWGYDAIADDFVLAEEIAKRHVDKSPADAEAVTVLAQVESAFLLRNFDFREERTALAKRYGERAVQLAPDDPEALYALGIYLVARGRDRARAEVVLRRACELAPDEPRFWRELSQAVSAQRPDEGIKLAEENIRRFPRDALTHYEAAMFYRAARRWTEWEREIDATLALAPIGNAMDWKARAAFSHGDLPGMRALLDRVPARLRGEERNVLSRVIYAGLSGNYDYGLNALQSFANDWFLDANYYIGPKSLLAATLLEPQGKTELARLQYEAALADVQRHLASTPNDVSARIAEVWIQRGLGHLAEARAANRVYLDALRRPYRVFFFDTWWLTAIPANLLIGERAIALQLIREAAEAADGRQALRLRMKLDPRMTPFRDDPEILALLRDPVAEATK